MNEHKSYGAGSFRSRCCPGERYGRLHVVVRMCNRSALQRNRHCMSIDQAINHLFAYKNSYKTR